MALSLVSVGRFGLSASGAVAVAGLFLMIQQLRRRAD